MQDQPATAHFAKVKDKLPILRLWEAPSFEAPISWTIFMDRSTEYTHPMVRKVTGSKFTAFTSRDVFKDMQEDTTFSVRAKVQDRYLKREEFDRLDIFRRFTISIVCKIDLVGNDGSYFGVQTQCFPTPLIWEWWEDGPDEWREITEWAKQAREFLSGLLDEQEKQGRPLKDINQQYDRGTTIWRKCDCSAPLKVNLMLETT